MDTIVHKFKVTLIDNKSMITSQVSTIFDINGCSCYAIQYVWSGFSGTGTCLIEVSNDDINFSQIDGYAFSGSTGNRMLNVEKAGYSSIRVTYTPSTATGTLTVIANGKVI